jgi:protein-L-isoaspartate(D-aspartate) O-methyltransferase
MRPVSPDVGAARRELAAAAERYRRPDRWAPVPAELDRAIAADAALAAAGLGARRHLLQDIVARIGGVVPDALLARYAEAIVAVPRERFVLPEDLALSADDTPLPLDSRDLATVSAPHAYLLTFGLLPLGEGDHLLELGTGTGYGAALAHAVVGKAGQVTSIEIDPELHARARRLLDGVPGVTLHLGDARAIAPELLGRAAAGEISGQLQVAVTYALGEPPVWLVERLPEGATLVAPVGPSGRGQDLVRFRREGGKIVRTLHGAVRYVAERR